MFIEGYLSPNTEMPSWNNSPSTDGPPGVSTWIGGAIIIVLYQDMKWTVAYVYWHAEYVIVRNH